MACGAAGNPIQFVQQFDGVSFRHAFELLANGSAFERPPDRRTKDGRVRKLECPLDPMASEAQLLEQVIEYYHQRLLAPESEPAREMLAKRGLWNEDVIKSFRIGYASQQRPARAGKNFANV